MRRSRPARPHRVLLLAFLLLPLSGLIATHDTAVARFGASRFGVPVAGRAQLPAQPSSSGDANGVPSVRLTWDDDITHVGVPTGLTLQSLDADGQPNAGVGSVVL